MCLIAVVGVYLVIPPHIRVSVFHNIERAVRKGHPKNQHLVLTGLVVWVSPEEISSGPPPRTKESASPAKVQPEGNGNTPGYQRMGVFFNVFVFLCILHHRPPNPIPRKFAIFMAVV